MGVNLGGSAVVVLQQLLYIAEVYARLQPKGG
jgi:hypothetical protein